jgi:hypothetical protein
MRTVNAVLVVGIAVLLAGCPAPSLQPLFTERDLIFDAGLVGTWTDGKGKDTWVVKRSGEKSYDLSGTEDGETHSLKLHLLQLGVYRFLDISPKEKLNSWMEGYWVPAHYFYRIRRDGDTVQVVGVEDEYLKPLIAAKKTRIAQMVDDGVLLTGSTKELQDYVLKHAEEEKAFTEPAEFHRVK